MDVTRIALLLRKVTLFESLPGETLLTVAEVVEAREMVKGGKIFAEGDAPDGIYIIASGAVRIVKGHKNLAVLQAHDFFGELGVLDNSIRLADAVATADGLLLFIPKEVFDTITADLPEVMQAVVRTVVGYLRSQDETVRAATMTHC